MVFSPGTYEHECPACGRTVVFVVSPVYCGTGGVKRPTCGGDDPADGGTSSSWAVKQRSYKGSLMSHVSDETSICW